MKGLEHLVGSVFLYILVATIGMKMDALAIFDNPGLFLIWDYLDVNSCYYFISCWENN